MLTFVTVNIIITVYPVVKMNANEWSINCNFYYYIFIKTNTIEGVFLNGEFILIIKLRFLPESPCLA